MKLIILKIKLFKILTLFVEVIKKQNVKTTLNQFIDNQKKIIENTPDATLEEKLKLIDCFKMY